MYTVQLELDDELAEELAPYRDRLPDLLRLGLRMWQEREGQQQASGHEHVLQVLAMSGQVTMPKPYGGEKAYVRHTPVPVAGKPVSEIVIEQR